MNWFQRYGIPGGYLVAVMVTWAAVSYRDVTESVSVELVAALILIAFLPVGYVLSVTAQRLYLQWFGLHRQALRQALHGDQPGFIRFRNEAQSPTDEATIEARTLLLAILGSASAGKAISAEGHQYIRDWIARRMDVLAINNSLILANVLGFVIAAVVLVLSSKLLPFLALFILLALLTLALVFSMLPIRRQILQAIQGMYQVYR